MTATNFPAIYAQSRRFTTGAPRTFTFANDGSEVLFLRSKGELDAVLCLWSIDTTSGSERLVVDPSALDLDGGDIPAAELARRERARESAAGIVSYNLSNDSTKACFALAGSLVVATIATGEITMPAVAGSVFDPRFAPNGDSVAYVSGDTLRVVDLDSGQDREVASSTQPNISWGAAEFVAAEEMGRNRGYWWAPDSESLLVAKVDVSAVDSWFISDPAHPQTDAKEIRYPGAGSTNASVQLWLISAASDPDEPLQVDWDGQGAFEYMADVLWPNEDSVSSNKPPLVVRQTRDQRTTSIASIDLQEGTVTDSHVITDDVWVELIPGSPSMHENGLLTVQDVTVADHRALCLNGKPLTDPTLQVRSILGTNQNTVTFAASPEPTEVHIYKLDLASGEVHQLTTEAGVHSGVVSADSLLTSTTTPTTAGARVSVNGHAISNLAAQPPMAANPEFHRFGNRKLSTAVFIPSDHDGTSPLPVLLDPYGGPHAQRVLKYHNPHLVSRWFADQGFAVVVTDGRGTPGRGPAFEREVWGDLAAPVLADQLDALNAAAAHFGFFDLERVGIRGWSFGGYLAALAAIRAPERIHAAIAGAPVTTWKLYDTHYTERYLGHPETHPDHYAKTDLISEAKNLNRPLLLIHGLADDNVVAAHTLQLSTALLAAGRAHQVLPLSGVTHMTPQVAVAENLLRLQLAFLKEHLAPKEQTV